MIIEKGYAKINLGLEVVKKREDGYHDLSMIMTSINLYDELYFEEVSDHKRIHIECDKLNHIKLEDNLVYKSIILIKDTFKIEKGIKVRIVKRIPEQAGLGGGSADAAATLRAVNQLWNLGLSLDELAKFGERLGSDIPFCIYNKTARVSGRGEVIQFIEEVPFAYIVLAFPFFKSSTVEAFRKFKVHGQSIGKIEKLQSSIIGGDIIDISNNLFNDLEQSFKQEEINSIKNDLIEAGAVGSLMTGSGSTVYGICISEKNAKNVLQRFEAINNRKMNHNKLVSQTIISSFRTSRKQKTELKIKEEIKENIILDSFDTKAYGMVLLGYQKIWKSYKILLTPVSLTDNIYVEKINNKISEVYFDEILEKDLILSSAIKNIVDHIDFGLRIKIKRKINSNLGLIDSDNYLSAIISNLGRFGLDEDKLYSLFPKKVQSYKDYKTILYDSKNDQLETLDDVVFGYVLIASMNIANYQSPRYTKQINTETAEIDQIIEGIREKNFYKIASNLYNGIEKFETRKIEEYRGHGFIDEIKQTCLNNGANGFILALDGKSIMCLCRNEKQSSKIANLLKDKFNFKDIILTSLKSNVTHQISESSILKTIPTDEFVSLDYKLDYNYDDTNPFGNIEDLDIDIFDDVRRVKTKKKTRIVDDITERDFEGILVLQGGGSLFKQYDFIDIANYFEKFFHGKYINFVIDDREIPIRFDISYLPHILGIHLLDEEDLSLKGSRGFEKLKNGEISYHELKKTGRISDQTLKAITNRTQSSVLIFNDIFNNRLYNISCFDRNVILGENSKMEMFDFGVTRRLTDTSFHIQNLLGIGREPNTNKHFFLTSFIWKVPAGIGKKDSYKIGISR